MTFEDIGRAHSWKPIPSCPGRFRLVGRSVLSLAALVSDASRVNVHRVAAASDPIHVFPLDDGGMISYERADGSFVHTLNTVEGFRRKLHALGITAPGGSQ